MLFSRSWVCGSLLTTALAQFNLTLAVQELPACALTCSGNTLPAAGCDFEDIPTCLCTNVTLQAEVAVCIMAACNQTEQYLATTVSQTSLCSGVPQPSRSREITRVVICLIAVTFPTIVLRLVSRYTISRIWWDDWAIIVSGLILVPMSVIPIYNATRGFGKHVWDVPPQNISSLEELYYISQILYAVVQNTTKVSILVLFLRIFLDKKFRLIVKICIVWVVCKTIAFAVAVALQCIPPASIWDSNIKGTCSNSAAQVYSGAAINILEDLVIILLPIKELKGLNLGPRKKLAVIFMFALGSFACITSMVRLKYLVDYTIASADATWSSTDVVIWSVLEIYTSVICACLMAIRPLISKYLPRLFQSTIANSSSPSYSHSRPYHMDSKAAATPCSRNNGSAVELKSTESAKVWIDAGSSHDERFRGTRGLEVWVTKSVEHEEMV